MNLRVRLFVDHSDTVHWSQGNEYVWKFVVVRNSGYNTDRQRNPIKET